jgi:hypothetical protein
MEDWQELLIITLIILIGVFAYFIYLEEQVAGLKDSISSYNNVQGAFGSIQGSGQNSGPAIPSGFGILNGMGG